MLDDIQGEASEVARAGNGWLAYTPALHTLRERRHPDCSTCLTRGGSGGRGGNLGEPITRRWGDIAA